MPFQPFSRHSLFNPRCGRQFEQSKTGSEGATGGGATPDKGALQSSLTYSDCIHAKQQLTACWAVIDLSPGRNIHDH